VGEDDGVVLRLPSLLSPPLAFAHRGARAHAPENTPEAFQLAVKLGATGIESDVWITADGALVLTHDGQIGLRRRPIRSFDRAELPNTMITLPELVASVPPTTVFSIDIKDDAAMEPLLTWAKTEAETVRERLYLCHPDWTKLAEWRAIDPVVKLVDSTSLKAMDKGPERRAHDLAEANIDGVNLRRDEWSGGMVSLFHRFDRLCFGWDAQHEHVLAELLTMGIDGVFSDHVDLMMDAVGQHGR